MRIAPGLVALVGLIGIGVRAEEPPLPRVPQDWRIELVTQAPAILFPTAIVEAPDGTVYLGQDPMDMPGPPTVPIDSIVAVKEGKVRVFAEKLWSVMGLEWVDGTLYVVHPPYLSALRDTDGDGKADQREDLITGLGPKLPGFSGVNDHVASGIRVGMDGFLYISVGDKGIPKGVGKDGTTISLFGGGVIRIRPDGTGLEIVSTGERNPLSVALTAHDEIFTYGNDDDSKKWPNSLTHHIVGGHYGYPYQFLTAPWRALPIVSGQIGGSGTQGVCYNEDGLPQPYQGNLFFTDWGLQTVFRFQIEKAGGTFTLKKRTPFVTRGQVADFRPFSMAVRNDGKGFWLVDWAFNGWLADGPKTGRLYRLTYTGSNLPPVVPRPAPTDPAAHLTALDHPALAVRLAAQRWLARQGAAPTSKLIARLKTETPITGRLHALWALDAIGTADARDAIRAVLADSNADVRLQAARSAGIRRDRKAVAALTPLLRDRDPAVRREAAIALGAIGDSTAVPPLMTALGDLDTFAAWSIRHAIRRLNAWDENALTAALLDDRRRDDALKLADEAWAVPVVRAVAKTMTQTQTSAPAIRARMVAILAGLYRQYPAWSGNWFGTNPLAGQLPRRTRDWQPDGMSAVLQGLSAALADADASVRFQAIVGLQEVGRPAASRLRSQLERETDATNVALLAQALGGMGDALAIPQLAALVSDSKRNEATRAAALDALGTMAGPRALSARMAILYDRTAPAALIARALPGLGREGTLPINDLAGFVDHDSPEVRAAALQALRPKPPAASGSAGSARRLPPAFLAAAARRGISLDPQVPDEVKAKVQARINDPVADVRKAAMEAVATLKIREAVPGLLVAARDESYRAEATLALTALPDPRAVPVYLTALDDRSPELRHAAESALLAIRETVATTLESEAKAGKLSGPAALAVERILTRFTPVVDWRVIGPFARTTARVFVGEATIDFGRKHSGAEGRTISWQPRKTDARTGRVDLSDFKEGSGDRGGFGYDTNGSPDLCAFGYAEVESDRDRSAWMRVGSSGTMMVVVNEKTVAYSYSNFAGRAYAPDSDVVQIPLRKGKNRLLVMSRQGIGAWSFSVQVSEPSEGLPTARPQGASPDALREFALKHQGDPRKGEELFFDPKGIGCVKCHAAGGRGSATVGPDLTGLALKYDRAEIIRSVLEPSNRIATGYQPVLVATKTGTVVTGLVRSETDAYIELVDADTKVTRIPKAEIDERRVGEVSVMPKGLVDTLSVVDFADLVSYLESLKAAPAAVKQ